MARFRRGAWVPLAGMACAALLLFGLRIYQQDEAASVFAGYLNAERQPLAVQEEGQGDAIRLYLNDPLPDMTGAIGRVSEPTRRGFYLAAVFDESRCANRAIGLRLTYTVTADDFSRDLVVSTAATGSTHVFFPIFTDGGHRFAAVEMAAQHRPCLAGLAAVIGYRSLPLPLWLRLPSNWREERLYQIIVW